jgi:hypothetical protein
METFAAGLPAPEIATMTKRYEVRKVAQVDKWPWHVYDTETGEYLPIGYPTPEPAQEKADCFNRGHERFVARLSESQ